MWNNNNGGNGGNGGSNPYNEPARFGMFPNDDGSISGNFMSGFGIAIVNGPDGKPYFAVQIDRSKIEAVVEDGDVVRFVIKEATVRESGGSSFLSAAGKLCAFTISESRSNSSATHTCKVSSKPDSNNRGGRGGGNWGGSQSQQQGGNGWGNNNQSPQSPPQQQGNGWGNNQPPQSPPQQQGGSGWGNNNQSPQSPPQQQGGSGWGS